MVEKRKEREEAQGIVGVPQNPVVENKFLNTISKSITYY